MTEAERRTLELLEANHAFPGDYPLTVIALNVEEVTSAVFSSIEETVEAPVGPESRQSRASSGGKYLSHRVTVRCRDAAQVLALYARLRLVDGVVTLL